MNVLLALQLAGMLTCAGLGLRLGFRLRHLLFSDPMALPINHVRLALIPALVMTVGLGFGVWAVWTEEAYDHPLLITFGLSGLPCYAFEYVLIRRLGFNWEEPCLLWFAGTPPIFGCILVALIYWYEHDDAAFWREQYEESKAEARRKRLLHGPCRLTKKQKLGCFAWLLGFLLLAAWGLTFVPPDELPDVIDSFISMLIIGCYIYEVGLLIQLPKRWKKNPLLWLIATVPILGCAVIQFISIRESRTRDADSTQLS